MNAPASPSSGRLRRLLIAIAIAGLAALVMLDFDYRPPGAISHPSGPTPSAATARERTRPAPIFAPSVAGFGEAAAKEQPRTPAQHVDAPTTVALAPKPSPFKLLGKVQDGDVKVLLLYRGGRVLSVRDGTPADDDYVVDALTDDYVVLRQRSTNESQIIQLAAREDPVSAGWSAENTSPD